MLGPSRTQFGPYSSHLPEQPLQGEAVRAIKGWIGTLGEEAFWCLVLLVLLDKWMLTEKECWKRGEQNSKIGIEDL